MSSASTPPSPSRPGSPARPARAPGTAAACREGRRASATGASRCSASPDSRSPSQPSASTATTGSAVRSAAVDAEPERGAARRRSALPGPADELQAGGEPPGVQLDPLPAQPDQRRLQLGQRGQLVGGERLVADGQVAAEVDDGRPRPTALRWPATVPGLRRGRGGQPDAEPGRRLASTSRAAARRSRRGPAAARRRAGSGARRRCRGQRRPAGPCAARRPAPGRAGRPCPARPGRSPAERRGAGPARAGSPRDRQTASASTTRLGSSAACRPNSQPPARRSSVRIGLDQPEAGPDRAGDGVGAASAPSARASVGDRGGGRRRRSGPVPVSAASQARRGRRARVDRGVSRAEPSAARAAASTRASRASAQTVEAASSGLAGGQRRAASRRASTRAQAASGPVSTGPPDRTRRIGEHRRQHPAPAHQVGGEAGQLDQVVHRGAAAAAVRVQAAQHGVRLVGVELEGRHPPPAGPHRRRSPSPISSRTSSGEASGPPRGSAGSGRRSGRGRDVSPAAAGRGASRPPRRTGGPACGAPAGPARWRRGPGGVLRPQRQTAGLSRRSIDQPAGVQDEHWGSLPLSSAGPVGAQDVPSTMRLRVRRLNRACLSRLGGGSDVRDGRASRVADAAPGAGLGGRAGRAGRGGRGWTDAYVNLPFVPPEAPYGVPFNVAEARSLGAPAVADPTPQAGPATGCCFAR